MRLRASPGCGLWPAAEVGRVPGTGLWPMEAWLPSSESSLLPFSCSLLWLELAPKPWSSSLLPACAFGPLGFGCFCYILSFLFCFVPQVFHFPRCQILRRRICLVLLLLPEHPQAVTGDWTLLRSRDFIAASGRLGTCTTCIIRHGRAVRACWEDMALPASQRAPRRARQGLGRRNIPLHQSFGAKPFSTLDNWQGRWWARQVYPESHRLGPDKPPQAPAQF